MRGHWSPPVHPVRSVLTGVAETCILVACCRSFLLGFGSLPFPPSLHKRADSSSAGEFLPPLRPTQPLLVVPAFLPAFPAHSWHCAGRQSKPSGSNTYECAILEELYNLSSFCGLQTMLCATTGFQSERMQRESLCLPPLKPVSNTI